VDELAVGRGDAGVATDHFEAGVAKDGLKGEEVTTIAQVVDGKCVAKAVREDALDAGPQAQVMQ